MAKSSLSMLLIPSSAEQSREERWVRGGQVCFKDSTVSRVSNPHTEEPGFKLAATVSILE